MDRIQNPILRGFNPDPSILRVDDTYYIATSTFEWFPGVRIYASKNLADWDLVARPLDRAELLDMRGAPDSCGVWAPALSHADGKYWLAYTNVRRFDGDFKDTPNYLTTSPSIDGPWSKPVYMNSSGFDPSLYHDDDGKKYWLNMVWDHRHDRTYFKGIVMQEYDAVSEQLIGPRKLIYSGSDTGYTEGPHIYKIEGRYYLIVAEGGTGYNHAVTIARSDDLWGPYETDPQLHVISAAGQPDKAIQRTGHGGLVQSPDGKWHLSHLCSRPLPRVRRSPMGRETALQEVELDQNGWFRLSNEQTAFESGEHPLVDKKYTFEGDLHDDFQWLRTPAAEEIFTLEDRPGYLRLIGRESPGSLYTQSIVARRQETFCFSSATCVEFEPDNFQQMAGLICYYNQHKFHYLYVSCDEEVGKHISIMSCAGDLSGLHVLPPMNLKPVPIEAGKDVHLKVDVDYDVLRFYWSSDGVNWNNIGPPLDASILSDEAGKGEGANFTGSFVGMACHDVTGFARPADFRFFSYSER